MSIPRFEKAHKRGKITREAKRSVLHNSLPICVKKALISRQTGMQTKEFTFPL